MNQNVKRSLSLLLSLLLLVLAAVPLCGAASEVGDGRRIPTIHVKGKVAAIYKNQGTPEEEMVFDNWTGRVPVPDGYIEDRAKALLPQFAKAVVTGDYDEWAAEFSQVLEPIYHDVALDKNGDPQYGTAIPWSYDPATLGDRADQNGFYATDAYEFEYDWRISPLQVVEDLRGYIEAVLAATGKNEYNLVARCEGACVAAAYLAKYPDERIRTIAYMTPCSNGCAQISCLFAGDVRIDTNAVNRYMSLNFGTDAEDGFGADLVGDPTVMQLLRSLISMLSLTHGLDLPARTVERIFNTVKEKVYPGLMMTSFGTFPGYWAMVDDARYEAAKKLCGIDTDPEYAHFVSLLDDYHYNVQNRQVEVLEQMKEKGAAFALLVKYGTEILPFIGDADLINDSTVTVQEASFGATTAPAGTAFSKSYVKKAEEEGEARYISPDRQIDARTCAFPDDTYFVKFCPHGEWYGEIYWWLNYAIEKGAAVNADTNDRYPRFLFWDRERAALSPLTEENAGTYEDYYEKDAGNALTDFVNRFIEAIRRIVELVRSLIDGVRTRAAD